MEKIKLFLPYFIDFEEDSIILAKQYSDNYTIEGLDWQLIIIIIYNKNRFFANNNCWKIWILENHTIFYFKRKSKGIMILDFLFS